MCCFPKLNYIQLPKATDMTYRKSQKTAKRSTSTTCQRTALFNGWKHVSNILYNNVPLSAVKPKNSCQIKKKDNKRPPARLSKHVKINLEFLKGFSSLSTCSMMSLTLSCSQSRITLLSFLFSRSWNRERYASSFLSSFRFPTLMAVTCHFLSAAVSRTTCSVVRPRSTDKWQKITFLPTNGFGNTTEMIGSEVLGVSHELCSYCNSRTIFWLRAIGGFTDWVTYVKSSSRWLIDVHEPVHVGVKWVREYT